MTIYRKLPIYFLISGVPAIGKESFEAISEGFRSLKGALLQDPIAVETVHVCVIEAGSDAWAINQLTPVDRWQPPVLSWEGSGEFALGAAFRILEFRIANEVTSATAGFPGDWCPLIFILACKPPTDDWVDMARLVLNRSSPRIGHCLTLLVGTETKPSDFEFVSGLNPMNLDDASPGIFRFFRWVDQ